LRTCGQCVGLLAGSQARLDPGVWICVDLATNHRGPRLPTRCRSASVDLSC
jgi:hypothetical protein